MSTFNQQNDGTCSMIGKKWYKSVASKENDDDLPRRRGVRFNEKVIFHTTTKIERSMKSTTWLSSKDYATIQKGVFMTLDLMYLIAGQNSTTTKCSSIYSRGLEDYSTQDKGYLKDHVIMRRKHAIYVVLQEQQAQRSRQQTIQQPSQQQNGRQGRIVVACNSSNRESHNNNTTEIRKAYGHLTTSNVYNAIIMGRYDSKEALAVYVEDKQHQHQQQQQQRQHKRQRQRQQQL